MLVIHTEELGCELGGEVDSLTSLGLDMQVLLNQLKVFWSPPMILMLNKKQPLNRRDILHFTYLTGFPGVLVVKSPPCQCGRPKWCEFHPRSGRSSGGGNSNPLQPSCLENPVDRGAWWVAVHKVEKSRTRLKQLSKCTSLLAFSN